MIPRLFGTIALAFMSVAGCLEAQPYTRGVGVYPGDPREDFAPSLVPEAGTYRNLALRRPAFHSSSYDYNLTAQLITDGIKDTRVPRWTSTANSATGVAKKNERDYLLDHNTVTTVNLPGPHAWVQIELAGGEAPREIDRVELWAQAFANAGLPEKWSVTVQGSDNGQTWTELGRAEGPDRPGRVFTPSVPLRAPSHTRFYRVDLDAPSVTRWNVGELMLFDRGSRVEAGGPYSFTSAWKSAGAGTEWVYVDLGAPCSFDRIVLDWIWRAAEGEIQASDDTRNWRTVQKLAPGPSLTDELKLAKAEVARYVRVLMSRPSNPGGYILSELEVWGRGGPLPQAKTAPAPDANGNLQLSGGDWRLERDSQVTATGEVISQPGFADQSWLVATVPATILSSYWNAGALPDPNYGDNQLMISDSYFYADFWYRNEFIGPRLEPGRHAWLNFHGVNWKADVFCNGQPIGKIEGGFMRGRFDITKLLKPGARNAIAVRIHKNATPGSVHEKTAESPDKNGGALGADNPTMHATIGWDWIPTIRGRDTGICSDVSLTTSGPVTIENPLVSTKLPLPATETADVAIEATLRNATTEPVSGTLRGRFGTVEFSKDVTVEAGGSQTVRLDAGNTPALHLTHPKLWWPNGYGAQDLYPVDLRFETAGRISDEKQFQAGVRQFTYSEEGGALRIWINGRRFVARGGNWGFPESMLRYRAREYDIAVRYHREMNFTMIRNWVGQTGDEAFYDACDRYGIVVWQDFWLANPADGPNPDDPDMFLQNAADYVARIRNHPSIGLYCGRNEGYPPPVIETGLRQILASMAPGGHYIASSADDVVSGHGPYRAQAMKAYFTQRATTKLHSEMGMPNIPTLDSVRQMMPESDQWPQAGVWGIHDFSTNGAQGGAAFRDIVKNSYGGADNLAGWVELAQFVDYDGYRGMFEAQSKNRMGLLIWMSHPAWPSFVWQTYDYYFDPSAAYFGAKKASEPLHIQWNPATDAVEVVNYNAGKMTGLTASAEILNLDGAQKWSRTATLDSAEDSVQSPIAMEYPAGLTAVHFIRLKLSHGGTVVSENFYMRGVEEANYKAIRDLPKVKVEAVTHLEQRGGAWLLQTELHNMGASPALMVRAKAVRETSGDRILPAIYSDNYVALMPGERKTISTEVANADTRGERPKIVIEGFNLQ